MHFKKITLVVLLLLIRYPKNNGFFHKVPIAIGLYVKFYSV